MPNEVTTFPGFAKCVKMMRSRDGETWESGYQWLLSRASQYFDQIVQLLHDEDSVRMKELILDLLVFARVRAADVFPIFVEYYFSDDKGLQRWAKHGIRGMNRSSPGRKLLWDAYLTAVNVPPTTTPDGQKLHEFIGQIINARIL